MKSRKNTILILLLGLLLIAFTAVSAQTPAQGDQKKSAEACCSKESCCNDDSCDMKKHDEKMKHDKDVKHECCNMKSKDKKKKVA